MTTIPSAIAAQAAIAQQNVSLSSIRQNAQQGQAVANILQEAVETSSLSASNGRGTNIDITV